MPTNSIFRRGGPKPELFVNLVDVDADYTAETAAKLQELYDIWKEPRVGRNLSGAVWRHERRVAEVEVNRNSKILDKMGFLQNHKLCLQVEEAIYLLDRGDLLLVVELGKGLARPLSLPEGYALLAGCGVPIPTFHVYCYLKRAGLMVKRYPARWTLGRSEDPAALWGDGAGTTSGESRAGSGAAAGPSGTPAATSSVLEQLQGRPSKRQRTEAAGAGQGRGQLQGGQRWWPGLEEVGWLAGAGEGGQPEAPRAHVAPDSVSELQRRLPLLRPFAPIPHIAELGAGGASTSGVRPVFDCYRPNPKFAKSRPDPVSFRICLAPHMPSLAEMHAMDSLAAGTAAGGEEGGGVKYCTVDKGDILFYEFQRVELANIM